MKLVLQYLDVDVAYLLCCIVARGESTQFDTDKEIRLGLEKIRERLMELLGADIRTVDAGESWDLVARMTRNTMAWRNINMLLGNKTGFQYFEIPDAFFEEDTPLDFKREFVRGYADVAGNIRPANRDQAGRHRVRLDILNYPTSWRTPVRLCILLQEQLGISVPLITWGHPNLGRQWREHQLNVYPEDFLNAGFYFDYKQVALQELAELNLSNFPNRVRGCPGARRLGIRKAPDQDEQDATRLPTEWVSKHFNAYWQICRALGCPRRPSPRAQLDLITEE
jgi:hypothetical protein